MIVHFVIPVLLFVFSTVLSLSYFARTESVREWMNRRDVWADDMLHFTLISAIMIGLFVAKVSIHLSRHLL